MIRTTTAALLTLLLAGSSAAWAQTATPAPGQAPAPYTAPTPGGRTSPAPASQSTGAGTGKTSTSALAPNQFSSEALAKAHCPGDTIVWANTGGSKAYHMAGTKYYGKTKKGAYMCQKEADQGGFHAGGRRSAKKPPQQPS